MNVIFLQAVSIVSNILHKHVWPQGNIISFRNEPGLVIGRAFDNRKSAATKFYLILASMEKQALR